MTEAKKKQIRRALEKWGEIAANPDQFKRVNISKLPSSEKKALAKTGYAMRGDHVFIPKEGFKNVSISHITIKDPKTGEKLKRLQINRVTREPGTKGDRGILKANRQPIYADAIEGMNDRDRLFAEYQAGKFKRGELIGLKVFDNNTMGTFFTTPEDAYKYMELIQWQGNVDPKKMRSNVHIVKYYNRDMNEAPFAKSSSQIRSEQRKRAAKRRGLGIKTKGRGPK